MTWEIEVMIFPQLYVNPERGSRGSVRASWRGPCRAAVLALQAKQTKALGRRTHTGDRQKQACGRSRQAVEKKGRPEFLAIGQERRPSLSQNPMQLRKVPIQDGGNLCRLANLVSNLCFRLKGQNPPLHFFANVLLWLSFLTIDSLTHRSLWVGGWLGTTNMDMHMTE